MKRASIFDYFTELEQKRQMQNAPPQGMQRPRLTPPAPVAKSNAAPNPFALTPDTTAPAVIQRPSLVGGGIASQTPVGIIEDGRVEVVAPPPPLPDGLELANRKLTRLKDTRGELDPANKVRNNDKGFLGRLGDIGRQLVIGAGGAYSQGLQAGLSPTEALAGSLGGGIAGGLYGGFHPQADEERQRLYDIQRQEGIVAAGQASKDLQLGRDIKLSQMENIKADNELNKEKVKDMRDYRTQTLEQRKAEADTKRVSTAKQKIFAAKRLDPNDPVHAAMLKEAGLSSEDVKGWDDRNPVEKTVAGVSYRLNRATGSYEPTNLPTDESKTLTDYTIKTPTGETRTYKVSARDAASFTTQMTSLGMRMEQQDRFQNQDLAAKEKENATRRDQFLENYKLKVEQMKQGTMFKKASELQKLEMLKGKGAISSESYDKIKAYLDTL